VRIILFIRILNSHKQKIIIKNEEMNYRK